MLNGDIFYGPLGAPGFLAPLTLDPESFVKEVSRVKRASVSLGWMSTDYAIRNRHYKRKSVEAM